MGEYPRRVVGGDLPALTRVWLRFLPWPLRALRSRGQNCSKAKQLGSSHQVPLYRRRAQALPIRRLSLAS